MTHEQIIKSCGCLPDVEDKRDFVFGNMLTSESKIMVPESFSLTDKQSSVKSQGGRGTCTAFASTALLEYFNGWDDLSEEYTFKKIKEFDVNDYGYDGYGAYLRSAAKAITKYGSCYEQYAPYNKDGSEDSWKRYRITKRMDEEAFQFRTASYASIGNKIDRIKKAMFVTNAPILTGITLYENYRNAQSNGLLPMPSGSEIGGHALLITAYDKDYFYTKNSWGKDWGDDGYLKIPINYHLFGSWSFIDVDNKYLSDEAKKKIRVAQCHEYQRKSFAKAFDKGIATFDSDPHASLTKGDYFVFKDRAGELD